MRPIARDAIERLSNDLRLGAQLPSPGGVGDRLERRHPAIPVEAGVIREIDHRRRVSRVQRASHFGAHRLSVRPGAVGVMAVLAGHRSVLGDSLVEEERISERHLLWSSWILRRVHHAGQKRRSGRDRRRCRKQCAHVERSRRGRRRPGTPPGRGRRVLGLPGHSCNVKRVGRCRPPHRVDRLVVLASNPGQQQARPNTRRR